MTLENTYDDLCHRVDNLMLKWNPCKWDKGNCARGTHGCCHRCSSLDVNSGCTIQSLACKLWICSEAVEKLPDEAIRDFDRLWGVAADYRLLTFRGNKQESIKNAKHYNAWIRRFIMVSRYTKPVWIFKPKEY